MRNPLVCLDSRLKLVITLVFLISCGLAQHIVMYGILFGFLGIGFALLPKKRRLISRFTLFLPFVFATFAFQLFFTPGEIFFTISHHAITYEGLYKGLVLGSRVLLAIGYSLIFVLSTSPFEIAKSLDWLTGNKLKLGDSLLVALKFADLVKNSPKSSVISTLKYAIEKSKDFAAK